MFTLRFSITLRRRLNIALILIGLLLAGTLNAPVTRGQTIETPALAPSVSMEDLYRSNGVVLIEGNNTVPFGSLKLKSYRLEEITLPKPIELSIGGNPEKIQKILRLTVTGESFQQGEYTIWLGEESLTDVRTGPTELTTIIFDRSTLEDGTTIAVSYETSGNHARTVLPETLYVPPQARPTPSIAPRNRIARIRKIGRPNHELSIEIALSSEDGFPVRNALRIFQLGDFETYGVGPSEDGRQWLIRVPVAVFAELKDGAFVFEKTERGKGGLRGARNFGRLNKALLEP